jgi:hypothetical protein
MRARILEQVNLEVNRSELGSESLRPETYCVAETGFVLQ